MITIFYIVIVSVSNNLLLCIFSGLGYEGEASGDSHEILEVVIHKVEDEACSERNEQDEADIARHYGEQSTSSPGDKVSAEKKKIQIRQM